MPIATTHSYGQRTPTPALASQKTSPYSISREAERLQRSVMRELLKRASDPDVISLAGGLPDSSLLPFDDYADAVQRVISRDRGAALQYRPQFEPLREWIAAYMQSQGVVCTLDQVLITNGNQQGLTILSRLFLDPGQPAAVEEITFTGIQQVTSGRSAQIHAVPVDLQTGVDTNALEALFDQYHPRLAVIIPNFHNPLGVSLSDEKRRQIAALAGQYRIPVIEDDPYAALRFSGEPLPPIKAYASSADATAFTFYLGSFSKMLAPGLRLGWMIVPAELMPRLITMRESIDLESSALTQRAVYELVSHDILKTHLARLNAENQKRCTALLDSLHSHFADLGAHWTQPDGGLFVWLTLPEAIDSFDLLPHAIEESQVAYIPGGAFSVTGEHRNTMRLNFSAVDAETIREGIARLSRVVHQQLEVPIAHR
jgi:2-aminoadipate transaminase